MAINTNSRIIVKPRIEPNWIESILITSHCTINQYFDSNLFPYMVNCMIVNLIANLLNAKLSE